MCVTFSYLCKSFCDTFPSLNKRWPMSVLFPLSTWPKQINKFFYPDLFSIPIYHRKIKLPIFLLMRFQNSVFWIRIRPDPCHLVGSGFYQDKEQDPGRAQIQLNSWANPIHFTRGVYLFWNHSAPPPLVIW